MTRTRWLLLGLVIVYILVAGVYSAVIPVFEGFDAQAHFAAVQYFRSERAIPELTPATVARSYELIPHPPLYYVLSALAAAPWPLEEASAVAKASVNAYFDKSLSARESITLPARAWQDLAPAWTARYVSTLGGLIVLLCTWWMARRLAPRAPTFALAAAAIAAFNPQFLFTAVTISNDAWSAATAALALAIGVDVVVARRTPRAWFWVGAATGIAALTKYSTLAVVLPLGILYLLYLVYPAGTGRRSSLLWNCLPRSGRRGWRVALVALAYAAAGFLVIAGWWFVRNWLLYGEVVPLNRMAEVLPTMRRAEPYTWQRTFDHIPWLIASFWGVFVAVIAPPLYLDATRWFMLIGFGGLLFGLLLTAIYLRRTHTRPSLRGLILYLVLLPWLGVVAAMVLYWTRTVEYGEQGRLAHVGASAFGVAMVAGWQAWLPADWLPRLRSWRRILHVLLAAGAVVTALALPPLLAEQLWPAASLSPSRWLPTALCPLPLPAACAWWASTSRRAPRSSPIRSCRSRCTLPPTRRFPRTTRSFLHVAGAGDQLLYQFDGVPVDGRHPTRQWIPGQVFADTHTITVDEISEDGLATLSMGFYPIADPSTRVEVYDANGQPIGDRLVLAQLRLHKQTAVQQPGGSSPAGTWQNGIVLDKAELATDAQGLPAGIALTWAPTATIQSDYTVFVQVLDAGSNILAQVDSQPQGGSYPTSTWRAGDVITDTVTWPGEAGTSGWARVILGLYGADGKRLPLQDGSDYLEVAHSATGK